MWLPLYLPPRGMTSRTSSLPGECRRHAQDCTHVPASPVTFANNTFVSSCSPLHFLLSRYSALSPFHLFIFFLFSSVPSSLTCASLHSPLPLLPRHFLLSLSPLSVLVPFGSHPSTLSLSLPRHLCLSPPTDLIPFALLSLSRHSSPVPSASLSLRGRGGPGVQLTLDKDRVQPDAPGRSAGPRALRG